MVIIHSHHLINLHLVVVVDFNLSLESKGGIKILPLHFNLFK